MPQTFGIEEEYLLVDANSGALIPRARQVLAHASAIGVELTSELNRCQIEIATGVCEDLGQAEAELAALRAASRTAGSESETRPAALGSHPFSSWYHQEINTDEERYVQMEETYQRISWQQAVCGCHIHVGLEDPDLRVAVMNRVLPWLPVLLALSANSPYWEGSDTGYASYRTVIWKLWPTATMPPRLDSFGAYERLVDDLEAIEAIDSRKALYWYVRPSTQFETLEFRVCDVCLRPTDAVTIAGLVRALVTVCAAQAARSADPPPLSRSILDSALWRAARYGLGDTLVAPNGKELRPAVDIVRQLVAFVRSGLEDADDVDRVEHGVEDILRRGTGSTMQRNAIARGGTEAETISRILTI